MPDVDILVNNAVIFSATPVFEIPDEEWQRFFDVNVLSGVRLARHYAPRMVARGWGRVIFVSSGSAVFIPTEMVHYGIGRSASRTSSQHTCSAWSTRPAPCPRSTRSSCTRT